MKLFCDTANVQEVRDGVRLAVVSGVAANPSLNPSLASAEGIGDRESYKTAVREIVGIIDGPISVEFVSLDVDGMVAEGRDIVDWEKAGGGQTTQACNSRGRGRTEIGVG